ncbi:hypothetical protein [Sphingomonas melonis]|uniref:hypothetical protein n=1 Tax=Sphingomonas melonis TaxID=152682 RepID=UPI001F1BB52A|nr:hypothetical protein [Sphingomonas melonis]
MRAGGGDGGRLARSSRRRDHDAVPAGAGGAGDAGAQADGVYLEAMLSNGRADPLTDTLLDHVRHRHEADAAAAREMVAAFDEADAFAAPETLGHMLRSFFTGCRRAVDFEQLAIIALAGHRLTPEARGLLVDALAESLAA